MNNNNNSKIKITPKEDSFSDWYLDVAKQWELFEYSSTPWSIIFLPKSVEIWEKVKIILNSSLWKLGVRNIYLPTLIPMSFFEKEKEHIEWFAPELAIITHWWGKELEEKLAFRPTSETVFCEFFKNQLQSYKDLPLLYNQWANVIRWEKRTRPFLRTAEFHWQEWHTIHQTRDEAKIFAEKIIKELYIKTFNDYFAIEWIYWEKCESEKFAWADTTFTFEPMMKNWWALQICTSHLLNQWFMKQFNVSYLNKEWKEDYPFYTSWWMSTRSIGWLILSHSDNKWLIIPPKLSEYKTVILPIYRNKESIEDINKIVYNIWKEILWDFTKVPIKWQSFIALIWKDQKILLDLSDSRFWEKINNFERSWYPIAITVWLKEIEEGAYTIISRITWEKIKSSINNINHNIDNLLTEWQKTLLSNNRKQLIKNTVACYCMEDIWKAIKTWKFAIYEWDKNKEFEREIKEKFKATIRCIPSSNQFTDDILKIKDSNNVAIIIARAF